MISSIEYHKSLLLLSLPVVTSDSCADVKSIFAESEPANETVGVSWVRSKDVKVLHRIESEGLWCDS